MHGPIEFDGANIEDFVILRSDGHPTYHLSVVSDDVEMAITHVVRGDDHISNTPKQILLYQALGAPVPQFAHVPLILGPDKKRLSKRHGATSVMEYARQGYLPEAMVNFLALLGWSPGTAISELFTRDELVGGVRARGHQRRQRRVQPREARLVQPAAHHAACARRARAAAEAVVRGGGLVGRRLSRRSPRVVLRRARAAEAAREAARRLRRRSAASSSPIRVEYDPAAVQKHLRVDGMREHLVALDAAFAALADVRCRRRPKRRCALWPRRAV